MKKILCALLAAAMLFSLCACGAGSTKPADETKPAEDAADAAFRPQRAMRRRPAA